VAAHVPRARARCVAPRRAGRQDITCDLPLEYLRVAAERRGFTIVQDMTQRAWLLGLGLQDTVEKASAHWRDRVAVADLDAIAARSRVHRGGRLTDPAGLGAHRSSPCDA
jgi:SAM-dependent MidA family methyltransferase